MAYDQAAYERQKRWRKAHPETWLASKKRYDLSEKGRATKNARNTVRQAAGLIRHSGPVAIEHRRAYRQVLRAIESGVLIRPETCGECGVRTQPYAHHHLGYDHPLDVLWLCGPCHAIAHGFRKHLLP